MLYSYVSDFSTHSTANALRSASSMYVELETKSSACNWSRILWNVGVLLYVKINYLFGTRDCRA